MMPGHNDPIRAVRDRAAGGLGSGNTLGPGEVRPESELDGSEVRHVGYLIGCPGCGEALSIPTSGPGQHWAESGNLDAGTLSFDAPLVHNACMWVGYLTQGEFIPI